MKVVLNGGAGFIGVALAQALLKSSANANVFVIDTPRRLQRVRSHLAGTHCLDYDDTHYGLVGVLNDADVLVHLAWSSQPANSMTGMIDDASHNIVGSLKVFTSAASARVRKIIFTSSGGTVYGNTDKLPIDETASLQPVSAYGVSKVAVERYLQLISFHHGLAGISLRIGNPYGPYQLAGTPIGVIAHFIRQLKSGSELRIFGDGAIIRDYIWIGDLANALVAAIRTDLPSGEYNIGSEIGHSINEVASMVEAATRVRASTVHISLRSFDAAQIVLSTNKFRTATDWEPRVALSEGIKLMVEAAGR